MGLVVVLGGLSIALGANEASAQLCDREGYVRHGVNCPNEARDATACCPPPRAQPRPAAWRSPCEFEAQVRSAATRGECCWPGQRWRDEACSGRPTRCPLGWANSGDACEPLDWSVLGWDYPHALGSTGGVRRGSLEAAFHDLGQARRELNRAPAEAAARYEAAVQTLEQARHRRAYVFRYHAASAWERAGEHERAVAQLAAYLRAGGEDPPPFQVRRVGFGVQLAAWRAHHLWPEIGPVWGSLEGQGTEAASSGALERLTAAAARLEREPSEAAAHYDTLQSELATRGLPTAAVSLHAAAAWRAAGRRESAVASYAFYLALGGPDPPAPDAPTISDTIREPALRLEARWRASFDAGLTEARAGRHARALAAFEASFARVDGHPQQAVGLLWLGRSEQATGEPVAALVSFSRAMRVALSGSPVRAQAEAAARAARGTIGQSSSAPCALVARGEVHCRGESSMASSPVHEGDGPLRAVRLTQGADHNCALTRDRRVRCWGSNRHGQLGDGSTIDREEAAEVSGLADVIDVAAGAAHTCALRSDGAVHCWGGNAAGQLGDGMWSDRREPSAPIRGLSDVIQVVTGNLHTCALRTGGTVACWGANQDGRLGAGSELQDAPRPVEVIGLDEVTALSAASWHTCALRSGGTVHCWGSNHNHQLGDGTAEHRAAPVSVAGLSDAVEIAAGSGHTCARLRSGTLRCWGSLVHHGTVWSSPRPVSGIEGALEVASGLRSLCSRHEDGTARCWEIMPGGQAELRSSWP